MAAQVQTYTVKGGDNLFSIAANIYKNPRMFAEIMRLNNLTSGVIRPGMVLKLPRNKPDFAINITHDLMTAIKAENAFVQQNGRLPTQTELSDFVANGGTTFGLPDIKSPANVPSTITDREIKLATGTGGLIKNYQAPTPTVPITDPNAPITKEEFERRKNIALIKQYEGQNPSNTYYENVYGEKPPTTPKGGFAINSDVNWNYFRQQINNAASQLVNPNTGEAIYPNPIPDWKFSLAQQTTVQPTTTPPTTYPVIDRRVMSFDTATPNVAKSTLQEQQLPDPTVDTNMNVAALQASGMNQDQANLYIRVLSSQNPTADDIYQFKYVFNVTDTSNLGKILNSKLGVVPPTNDQIMINIWDELRKTGGYNMPTEWIINQRRGGGGRGGAGGGGSSTYFGGNSATYGGF